MAFPSSLSWRNSYFWMVSIWSSSFLDFCLIGIFPSFFFFCCFGVFPYSHPQRRAAWFSGESWRAADGHRWFGRSQVGGNQGAGAEHESLAGDGERWGEMGRDGERWGEMGRDGERWGEMGRDGERWGEMGRFEWEIGICLDGIYISLMEYLQILDMMGFINNKIIWVCPFEWGTYCHRYGQFESGTDSHGPGAHFGLIPIPTTRSGHQGNKKGKFLQRWGWFFEFLFQFGEVLQRHFLKPWDVGCYKPVQSWQPILWIFSHQVTRWWDFRLWVAARQTMNLRLYEKPGGLVDLEQVLKDWWNMVWVGTFRPRTLLDVGAIGNRKESFFKHISTVGQVLMGNTVENPLNTSQSGPLVQRKGSTVSTSSGGHMATMALGRLCDGL